MFLGQYDHNIDDKGRLTIPARFRELLAEGAYVTQGFDGNLLVLTTAHFNRLSSQVNATSLTDPASRSLRRLIFSYADRVEVDKAGRILIPQFLRQAVGLESTAVVVGAGDFFEIWQPELWQQVQTELENNDANNARFSALNLPV